MLMNLLKKRQFILILMVLLPLTLFAGGKKEAEKQKDNPPAEVTADSQAAQREEIQSPVDIAARVNGIAIPLAKFNSQVEATVSQYTQQGMALQNDQMSQLRESVLNNLINQELLYQDALKKGMKVADEEIQAQMDKVKGQFKDDEEYQKALSDQGITEELLVDDLKMNIMLSRYIEEEFKPRVEITEDEEAAFYGQNPQYFSQPEQVRASHILIQVKEDADDAAKAEAKKKIEDVQKRLENGEEFSDLAREVSEGPSSKNGGDLGFFGKGQMVKPFEDAVFGMKKGEISGIVETQFGYHIIKLTDRKPAGMVPFDQVKGQIADHLFQMKLGKVIQDYIDTLIPGADIEKLVS